MAKKWIAGAIQHPGALTRKAKAAHMTVAAFEAHPPNNTTTQTKHEITFAKTLKGFHHPHMGHK